MSLGDKLSLFNFKELKSKKMVNLKPDITAEFQGQISLLNKNYRLSQNYITDLALMLSKIKIN